MRSRSQAGGPVSWSPGRLACSVAGCQVVLGAAATVTLCRDAVVRGVGAGGVGAGGVGEGRPGAVATGRSGGTNGSAAALGIGWRLPAGVMVGVGAVGG